MQLAKMMRYINIKQLYTDATFAFFMISWLISRHCFFVVVVISTINMHQEYIPYKLDPANGYYLTKSAHIAFAAMLIALEVSDFKHVCRLRQLLTAMGFHRSSKLSGSG